MKKQRAVDYTPSRITLGFFLHVFPLSPGSLFNIALQIYSSLHHLCSGLCPYISRLIFCYPTIPIHFCLTFLPISWPVLPRLSFPLIRSSYLRSVNQLALYILNLGHPATFLNDHSVYQYSALSLMILIAEFTRFYFLPLVVYFFHLIPSNLHLFLRELCTAN